VRYSSLKRSRCHELTRDHSVTCCPHVYPQVESGRASTSTRWHFAFRLCCHGNETRAPIANPPNSAQLGDTHHHSPSYIRVRAVVLECGEGQTHRRPSPIYISPRLRLMRNVLNHAAFIVQSLIDRSVYVQSCNFNAPKHVRTLQWTKGYLTLE